jgi:hypothetical protein
MNLEPTTPEEKAQLEAAAQHLYENNANRVKPSWDQIGDYTKQVWRDYALHGDKPLDLLVSEETLDAALDADPDYCIYTESP